MSDRKKVVDNQAIVHWQLCDSRQLGMKQVCFIELGRLPMKQQQLGGRSKRMNKIN